MKNFIENKIVKGKQTNHVGNANNTDNSILVKKAMQRLGVLNTSSEQNLIVNTGTTSERSVTPVEGETRYNTSLSRMETYVNGAWTAIGGTALTADTGVNITSNVIKLGGSIPSGVKTTIGVSTASQAALIIKNDTTAIVNTSTAFMGSYYGTYVGDNYLTLGYLPDGIAGLASQANPTYNTSFSGFQVLEATAGTQYEVFMNHKRIVGGFGHSSSIGIDDSNLRLFRGGNFSNGNTQILLTESNDIGFIKFQLANNLTGGPAIQDCMTINMVQGGTFTGDTILKVIGLPIYANNAAAVSAGLAVNTVYKTSTGELRIVV